MLISFKPESKWDSNTKALSLLYQGPPISIIDLLSELRNDFDNNAVKKQDTQYTVEIPSEGGYRDIHEHMTGDQLAKAIPTIVFDLQSKGVL